MSVEPGLMYRKVNTFFIMREQLVPELTFMILKKLLNYERHLSPCVLRILFLKVDWDSLTSLLFLYFMGPNW